MEMLVGEQEQDGVALLLDPGREEKPDQLVSEQPKVPDVLEPKAGVGAVRGTICCGRPASDGQDLARRARPRLARVFRRRVGTTADGSRDPSCETGGLAVEDQTCAMSDCW
jgi:hypothetical protein